MKYCSECGAPVQLRVPTDDDRPRYICDGCGRIHYENPKMVVGCVPEWEDRILLCRRNIEPQKDLWTLPAGYLENGEGVADGARRETLEESGAIVDHLEPYLLIDIVHIRQIYLMFRGRMQTPEFKVTPESAEVVLMREDQIPWDQLAFRAIEKTLRYYFRDRAEGRFPFRVRPVGKRD
ncbi:MAG: NUDIX hydrolase [Desulfobacteraceae bacterium]|nr:NUDIX hydrolase [Desulfobacteraceae bacterium]